MGLTRINRYHPVYAVHKMKNRNESPNRSKSIKKKFLSRMLQSKTKVICHKSMCQDECLVASLSISHVIASGNRDDF